MKSLDENTQLNINETTEGMMEVGPLILGLDANGDVIFFNEKCEEVTGFSEKEVVGRSISEFFPEDIDEQEAREYLLSTDRETLPKFRSSRG